MQNFRIIDDEFLRVVFENNIEGTELLLNIIFDRNDMKVSEVTCQWEIKGLEGHSVRLDISAKDSENNIYDIEVQRQDEGNLPLRARYYSSMLDTTLLKKSEKYEKLVPTFVIFITETDVIGDGLPLHDYVMTDIYTDKVLGDNRHIIFINGDYNNKETRLGKLMHDFKCTSADDMYFDTLAKRVRHFKETEGGIQQMSKIMEEIAVLTLIDGYRDINMLETEIKQRIMKKYNLSEEEADSYMLEQIA